MIEKSEDGNHTESDRDTASDSNSESDRDTGADHNNRGN